MRITLKRGCVVLAMLTAGAPLLAAPAKPVPARPAAAGDVTRAQMRAETKRVFDLADTNRDGFMSPGEFRVRMGAVLNRTPPGMPSAPSPADAQKMLAAADAAFKAVDGNGDGKLSLTEASTRPLAAFDSLDANRDGVLTAAEKLAARTIPEAPAKPAPARKLEPGR